MARFVSRYGAYSHGVREEIAEQFARGTRVIQKSLEAQFGPRGLTDYEKEVASSGLSFHGLPEDRDTGYEVSPYSRMSLFDSDVAAKEFKWNEEEHDLVVQTLRESDRNGLDYIEVERPKRPAPWKGYDKLEDVEQIVELALATETDLSEVLAYERENRDREELVELIESFQTIETPAAAEVVITA